MDYAQQLKASEDQVTQLRIKLEELKMLEYEKDKAYAKCKCQIQELESQGVILTEEVTKFMRFLTKEIQLFQI